MDLKLIFLAIVIGLYATEAAKERSLGDDDYLPCEYCNLQKEDYPEEGYMACYEMKRTNKTVVGKAEVCKIIEECNFLRCRNIRKCGFVKTNVTVLDCKLVKRFTTREINQRNETFGTIYQINSPYYFANRNYPHGLYCVWNIANAGFVTYRIVEQHLQGPGDCDGPGCDCPDSMKIKMGANEIKLCGAKMPPIVNQMSTEGLQVKFCSDNEHNAKGVLLMAYRHNRQMENMTIVLPNNITNNTVNTVRRQTPMDLEGSCPQMAERMAVMSNNMSEMGCQYEYMMRMTQPGVPCPDDQTIMTMVKSHDYMMSGFRQTMPMCDGMDGLTTSMPMMNSIESCAVDYLYRTRDCEFAKSLVDSANGELSDVARMIANNNFPIKVPKWSNIASSTCKKDQ